MIKVWPAVCTDCGNTEEFNTAIRIAAKVNGLWKVNPETIELQDISFSECCKCKSQNIDRRGKCAECGADILISQSGDGDEGPICSLCASENYCECTGCGEYHRFSKIIHPSDDEWYCPYCARDRDLVPAGETICTQ